MPRLYALILKPSQSIPFVPPPDGQLWYLRHAALAAGGSFEDYANISFKTSDGPEVSLGTLRRERDYMSLDLPLGEYVEFKATGNVEVHLTGHLVDDGEMMDDDEDLEDLEGENGLSLCGMDWDIGMKAALMNGGGKGVQMMMALQDSEESEEEPVETSPVIEEVTPEPSSEKAKRKAPAPSPESQTPDRPTEKKGKTDNTASQEAPTTEEEDKPKSKAAAKRMRKKQRREAEAQAQSDVQPDVQADVQSDVLPQGQPSKDLRSSLELPKTGERKKKRIRRFSNGFVIENLSYGSQEGPVVTSGVNVSIKYLGKLEDGTVFDRSDNTIFTYKYGAGEVVKGLDKGLDDMQVGDKRKLIVPPKMGYGSSGAPPAIPPDSTLYFEIELIKIDA